jgi:hypothetical protein
MERVKRVDLAHTASTEELNRDAINTTELALVAAEFATVTSGDSSTFEPNKLFDI